MVENANLDGLLKQIANMNSFLQEQVLSITKYDEPLVQKMIEKVIVYEDKFIVALKSGVTVDVI